MDLIFKQKLLTLRHPPIPATFAEALLKETNWYRSESPPDRSVPSFNIPGVSVVEPDGREALEKFAHQKAEELRSSIPDLNTEEVTKRSPISWVAPRISKSTTELFKTLTLEPDLLKLLLGEKEPLKVKVLFVSEKFRQWTDVKADLKESGLINEILAGFPLKTAELFERMILAMKLTPSEFCLYPVEGDSGDLSGEVLNVAAFLKPEILVTLGAKATSSILMSQDRLAMVHGQFFNRKLEGSSDIQVVPLFHPSIIETNQNMKKTAWTDMQKIMKFLKKIP